MMSSLVNYFHRKLTKLISGDEFEGKCFGRHCHASWVDFNQLGVAASDIVALEDVGQQKERVAAH